MSSNVHTHQSAALARAAMQQQVADIKPSSVLPDVASLSLQTGAAAPIKDATATALPEDLHPRIDVTPVVGTEFTSATQIADLLERDDQAAIKEIARLISERGVCMFRSQDNLPQEKLTQFARLLHKYSGNPQIEGQDPLHIHPLEESVFGEFGEIKNVAAISNFGDEGRRISTMQNEKSRLSSSNWHTDISFERAPAAYSLLKMHTIPPTGGDTLFASMYEAYNRLSPPMREMLAKTHSVHDAAVFRSQAQRFGFELFAGPRGHPENVGRHVNAIHPTIRTHPLTGRQALYVNKGFTTRIEEMTPDESEVMLNYLYGLVYGNHDLQCRHKWTVNDLVCWDNAAVQHSATFDFGDQKRGGERCVVVGGRPFYDPAAKPTAA